MAKEIKDYTQALVKLEQLREGVEKKLLERKVNYNIIKDIIGDNNGGIKTIYPVFRREFSGHYGKIYGLDWSSNSELLVTAAQDGKLIIWNPKMNTKCLAITLESCWVMHCQFSPNIELIASGGLDNRITLHRINSDNIGESSKTIYGCLDNHQQYISCSRFIDDHNMLSASGDSTIIHWNLELKRVTKTFKDHPADVMSIDVNPNNPSLFCSGSVDCTVRVWDIRASSHCIYNFKGHQLDVNCVKWFSDNQSILSGSEDGDIKLFDLRSYSEVQEYRVRNNRATHDPNEPSPITQLDVSISGAYIFSAYDNGKLYTWNSLNARKITSLAHEERVSCLQVSPNGYGLATGCWDFFARMFF